MTRPLRVVHVTFDVDARRRAADVLLADRDTLVETAIALRHSDVDPHVIAAAHEDWITQRDGVPFEFLNDQGAMPVNLGAGVRLPRRPNRIIWRIAALAPELVHVHGLHHPLAVRQLADAIAPVPVLAQDHGNRPPVGWRRHAHRWAYRSLRGAAFTSREQASTFVEARTLSATLPIFEVLGGSSRFTPGSQTQARSATGLHGDPCVLWTGRLDANKDPLTMLSAFEHAVIDLPNARLWCCYGDAPLLAEIRSRIEQSPALRSRVTLLGTQPRDAMEMLFRAADFYLQTSWREASGFSLIEAMACGVTPIVTDIPASRRIVGATGSLTPCGDAAAMGRALADLAHSDRVGQRQHVRAEFEARLSFEAIARELRFAYDAIVSQPAT
jgi:glycosyltransferase involved in cell wall biosynthesis